MAKIILCGNGCGHNHESLNGPTGCCAEHGPYMYYCNDCHERWRAANPDKVEKIRKLAAPAHKKR